MLNKVEVSQLTKLAIVFAAGFAVGLLISSYFEKQKSGGDQPMNESQRALKLTSDEEASETVPMPERVGHEMLSGGLAASREANDDVKAVVEKAKPLLEKETKTEYEFIQVLSYKPQIVAGMNYFVKAKAKPKGKEEGIIHLRIYKNLSNEIELTAYQLDKTENEELKYFQ